MTSGTSSRGLSDIYSAWREARKGVLLEDEEFLGDDCTTKVSCVSDYAVPKFLMFVIRNNDKLDHSNNVRQSRDRNLPDFGDRGSNYQTVVGCPGVP